MSPFIIHKVARTICPSTNSQALLYQLAETPSPNCKISCINPLQWIIRIVCIKLREKPGHRLDKSLYVTPGDDSTDSEESSHAPNARDGLAIEDTGIETGILSDMRIEVDRAVCCERKTCRYERLSRCDPAFPWRRGSRSGEELSFWHHVWDVNWMDRDWK